MYLPYVYKLTNKITEEFYIGYRYKNVQLEKYSSDDLGKTYYTSSNRINKHNIHNYEIEIIAEFFNKDDAYDYEQLLIHESWDNPILINKSCYHNKKRFKHTEPHTADTRKKMVQWRKDNPEKEELRAQKIKAYMNNRTPEEKASYSKNISEKMKVIAKNRSPELIQQQIDRCKQMAKDRGPWNEKRRKSNDDLYLKRVETIAPEIYNLYDNNINIRQISIKTGISWDRIKLIIDRRELIESYLHKETLINTI